MIRMYLFDAFASTLSYPAADYPQHVEASVRALRGIPDGEKKAEAVGHLEQFTSFVRRHSTAELEESYAHTFDINPVSCLEVGWHLFGESYDRGAFLVRMRESLRLFHLQESTELPDHLSHVLALIGRMDPEEGELFASTQVIPGVKKMLTGFEGKSNPYESLLRGVLAALQSIHANPDPSVEEHGVEKEETA